MKPLFRLSMALAFLGVFAWSGGLEAAMVSGMKPLEGEDPPAVSEEIGEIRVAETGPVMEFGTPEYAAALERCTLPAEFCGYHIHRVECGSEVCVPEAGTYEYGTALETGNLPSLNSAPTEVFDTVEIGGHTYRVEIDLGGG